MAFLVSANTRANRTDWNERDLLVLNSGYHCTSMTGNMYLKRSCVIPSCIRRRSNFPICCVVHALYTPKLLTLTSFPSLLALSCFDHTLHSLRHCSHPRS